MYHFIGMRLILSIVLRKKNESDFIKVLGILAIWPKVISVLFFFGEHWSNLFIFHQIHKLLLAHFK